MELQMESLFSRRLTTCITILTCAWFLVFSTGCRDEGAAGKPGPGASSAPTTPEEPSGATTRANAPEATGAAKAGTKSPPIRTGGAMLYMAEPRVDFGPIADYETRTVKVGFLNSGDQTLEITRVQPTCGCTTTALDQKLFAPGEGSEIELTFKPKGSGSQTKLVKVHTNDSVNPVQTITIKANVSTTVSTTPKSLAFGTVITGTGDMKSVIMTAEIPSYEPKTTKVLGQLREYATARIVPISTPGARKKSWRVEVALKPDIPWGWYTGSLQIVGNLTDPVSGETRPKTTVVGMNASIEGEIRGSDTIFRLMILNTNKEFKKSLTLRREGKIPFNIISAEVENARPDNMVVAFTPVEGSKGSAYELVLAGKTGNVNTSIMGQVRVRTDVPGEEEIVLRIAGSVRDRD